MNDQSRKRNEDPWDRRAPGKRLEKKLFPTAAQAREKREKRVMIIMIAAAAVMVAATALVLAYNYWFQEPELPPAGPPAQTSSPDPLATPGESGDPEFVMDTLEPKVGGERRSDRIFTILIFGTDETSGLTDTMMAATYDVTNQRATVMSLPRDTLINSSARPGIDAKKLNAVFKVYGYGEAGAKALENEVSELVGFVPDYYVQIDWALVGEMVDAIGGVWFDNPYHMEYYDPYQDLNIYQEKGYRKLSGSDAMQVVRWRHNNPGVPYNPGVSRNTIASDLERLEVQHAFLKAVLRQTLQIGNLARIDQLIRLFESRVKSDLDVKNMLWFGSQAVLGGLQVEDVEFCTMPTAGGSYGKRDFVYPIQSQLLAIINQSLNPYKEEVTIRQLDLMSPNGNGGLRSSTGRLAAPELAYPPVVETDPPEESAEPGEDDPLESGEPGESGPLESGEPGDDSLPGGSEPGAAASGEPGAGGPDPASGPDPDQDPPGPEETIPAWLLPPAEAGGSGDGDGGAASRADTPD